MLKYIIVGQGVVVCMLRYRQLNTINQANQGMLSIRFVSKCSSTSNSNSTISKLMPLVKFSTKEEIHAGSVITWTLLCISII